MRFATFMYDDTVCTGIAANGGYYVLSELVDAPDTLLEFIKNYENRPLPDFSALINEREPIPTEHIKLMPPLPTPFRNIICLGKNYADHAKEVNLAGLSDDALIPSKPVYFSKNANPSSGDKDTISLHNSITSQVDYEVELAVVIGKTAYQITPEQAESVIFGYTIMNDITARDIQTAHGQWYFGKSLDGFCSLGPHIVTRDEIPFPVELDISCRVNGKTMQASNTSLLIFDIPRIISELSQGVTLYPGDIIATGTPAGIGHAKNPPVYLKKGDVVQCEIEKIGVLTNIFE